MTHLHRLESDFDSCLRAAESEVEDIGNILSNLLTEHWELLSDFEEEEGADEDDVREVEYQVERLFTRSIDSLVSVTREFDVDAYAFEDDLKDHFDGVIRGHRYDRFADTLTLSYW